MNEKLKLKTMKKFLSVFTLCLMSVFAFAQNYTMVPVQPQNNQLTIAGVLQLNINPYDPSEIQLEPMNGCKIAVPSNDQMYTVAEFTVSEMMNHITSPWQYWTNQLATVPFDATTGYGFLKFSNGDYGYAHFDMSIPGWTEFGYFKSSVGIAENEITFSIYPNPATSNIMLDIDNFCAVEIYNNCGQLVMTSSDKNINVSNLENGVYLLSVIYNNGNVCVKKIVKE